MIQVIWCGYRSYGVIQVINMSPCFLCNIPYKGTTTIMDKARNFLTFFLNISLTLTIVTHLNFEITFSCRLLS